MGDSESEIKPSFKCMVNDETLDLMKEYIEEVNSIMETPAPRILLNHTKWDKHELLQRLTDDKKRCELFKKAHVLNVFDEKTQTLASASRCHFCSTNSSDNETFGLGCDHVYCNICWRRYLTGNICQEGIDSICCPSATCDIVVDDDIVMRLLCDEDVKRNYQLLMIKSFVKHNDLLSWCPSERCKLVVNANRKLKYQFNCECQCGQKFCFNCGDDPHDPVPCHLMKHWTKNMKTMEHHLVSDFLKNSKHCPKCTIQIGKTNGHNNQTICLMCSHQFCWLCLEDLRCDIHTKCNTDEATNADEKLDCFKRYYLRKESLEIDMVKLANTIQAMGQSNEVQFIKNAFEILRESHEKLMFTYIFEYYVKLKANMFEHYQSNLEQATDDLHECLERDITQDKVDVIINKSYLCKKRLDTMQQYIFDGFDDNSWTFIDLV